MKNLLTQIKNEWRSNLFLLVELLLVFAVLWYIVDWVTVTARVYRAPMGFDTEHCYNLSFSTLTSKSALYNPELTVEDNIDALLEITERLRHRPGVEAVSISQNCYPYNEGSNSAQFYLQDSIHVGAYLVWSDPDFYRVFRYQAVDGGSSEQLAAAISDQTMIITSNITEDYPVLDLPDARPLLNRVRPFFCGRKPSKQNFSFGKPEATKAGTRAVAPGKHCTSIPLRTHSRTTRKPGSEIPGVPASDINATVSPAFILLTTLSTILCSLNL